MLIESKWHTLYCRRMVCVRDRAHFSNQLLLALVILQGVDWERDSAVYHVRLVYPIIVKVAC